MDKKITCPHCGKDTGIHRSPGLTVDIIINLFQDDQFRGIVLIERKNYPQGWALPGGYVDYGETTEDAAIREAWEETSLDVQLIDILGVYSDPGRDDRQHNVSVVYIAEATGEPKAADDAKTVKLFFPPDFPDKLCFDHDEILEDYMEWADSLIPIDEEEEQGFF